MLIHFSLLDIRISCISFNILCIISDIVAFIIVATKPGNIIDDTISDQTADIVLSIFFICSVFGIIGGIMYEPVWVSIPRFAYIIKAVLAGLAGIFIANVATAAVIPAAPSVIISFLGEERNAIKFLHAFSVQLIFYFYFWNNLCHLFFELAHH